MALEVGVGNGVVADRALATGVLEFLQLFFFCSFNYKSEKLKGAPYTGALQAPSDVPLAYLGSAILLKWQKIG